MWREELDGKLRKLPALPPSVRFIHCMVIDAAGQPWISAVHGGFTQFIDDRWQPNGGRAELPTSMVTSQARAPGGELWFGYRDNHPMAKRVNLPARVRDVQFNYTALTLSRPERTRFRYRLAGYLHPIVREEAARIAIEAMANALTHAAANSIEVQLSYDRRALRINIKDDGRGMEASMLSDGREGHFGFAGMKERAARIRGTLRIWSRPGAGTEVNLTVPAGMAYVRRNWKSRFTRVFR